MSFILVTYGYNQYSIFNTNTSTPTLIDNIKNVALNNIIKLLHSRDVSLQKEIETSIKEEENLNKLLKSIEQDLKIEEDKYNEEKRKLEEKLKKEEKEKLKKEKEEKEKKKEEKKKDDKTKVNIEDQLDNKAIIALQEKLTENQNQLNNLIKNKDIKSDKKKKLEEILIDFKKKNKDKVNLKIELFDSKGEVVNINENIESIANEFLLDKTVFELYYFKYPEIKKKEEKKKEEKKEEEKKEEKKKEEKNGVHPNPGTECPGMGSGLYRTAQRTAAAGI